jgi:hypothetical protein
LMNDIKKRCSAMVWKLSVRLGIEWWDEGGEWGQGDLLVVLRKTDSSWLAFARWRRNDKEFMSHPFDSLCLLRAGSVAQNATRVGQPLNPTSRKIGEMWGTHPPCET